MINDCDTCLFEEEAANGSNCGPCIRTSTKGGSPFSGWVANRGHNGGPRLVEDEDQGTTTLTVGEFPFVPGDPVAASADLALPDDDALRGNFPMASGFLDYFPLAAAYVSWISKVGNDQHNPGEAMHWARDKSTDHCDKVLRHLVDRGKFDGRGVRHTGRAAWRIMAMLQTELEQSQGLPQSRASTGQAPLQA